MLSSSFGNPLLSDASVRSVTRLLRRTRDIACSVQKRLSIAVIWNRPGLAFMESFNLVLELMADELVRGNCMVDGVCSGRVVESW